MACPARRANYCWQCLMSSSGKFYTNNYSHLLVCANICEATGLQDAVFRLEALHLISQPRTPTSVPPCFSCPSLRESGEPALTNKQGSTTENPSTSLGPGPPPAWGYRLGPHSWPSTISSSLVTWLQSRTAKSVPLLPTPQ